MAGFVSALRRTLRRTAPLALAGLLGLAWACPPPFARDAPVVPTQVRALADELLELIDLYYLYDPFVALSETELDRSDRALARASRRDTLYRALSRLVDDLDDQHSVFLSPWESCDEDAYFAADPGVAVPLPRAARIGPGDRYGLLQVASLDSLRISGLVDQALGALVKGPPLDGLVLDLRGNGGGYLDVAYDLLSQFLSGPAGSEVDASGRYPVVLAPGVHHAALAEVPLVVLVDGGTASAAEIVAGALQRAGRARVVGRTSAGNTELIQPFDLSDGSRLWLAVAGYELEGGGVLEGVGVHPDLQLSFRDVRGDRALRFALAPLP